MIDQQVFANYTLPDEHGNFGRFGGTFAPETLMPAIGELVAAYTEAKHDPAFQDRP